MAQGDAQGPGGNWFMKKPEVENLKSDSLNNCNAFCTTQHTVGPMGPMYNARKIASWGMATGYVFYWQIEQNQHCLSNESQNNLRRRNLRKKTLNAHFLTLLKCYLNLTFFTLFSDLVFKSKRRKVRSSLMVAKNTVHPGRENFVGNFSFLILKPL